MGYDYYDNYLGNAVNATNTAVTIGGVFAIIFAVIYALIIIAIAVLTVIGLWKVFEKNKMPGWYAVIPGFNIWMYFELNKIPGWAIFLPGANVIYLAIASYRLCTKMGKDLFFSVIMMFLEYDFKICLAKFGFLFVLSTLDISFEYVCLNKSLAIANLNFISS